MPLNPLSALDRTSATFKADLDAFFLTHLPNFSTQAEALRVEVVAAQASAAASAGAAATQAGLATTNGATQVALATTQAGLATTNGATQVGLATTQATTATTQAGLATAIANYKGTWASLTGALNMPASVSHSGAFWALNTNLANVTTATPGVSASWSDASAGKMNRVARTANTVLAGGDRGSLIDITSGTFTQTFTAAATLGSGWYCHIRNKGGGAITLDPNAAETIDGASTIALAAGETRVVLCDGTAFETVVIPNLVAPGAAGNTLVSNGALWTSAAPTLATAQGIGAYALAAIVPTAALAAGQSVAGSSLQICIFTFTPAVAGGAYLTGTWRAMTAIPSGQLALFMRIA